MENLQDIFIKGYNDKKIELGHNEVHIGEHIGTEECHYVEKDFYWCGFSKLYWHELGKYAPKQNKGLKKLLESFGYEVGHGDYLYRQKSGHYTLHFRYGNHGNGDHELQVGGYNAVSNYLNGLGYKTAVESCLD